MITLNSCPFCGGMPNIYHADLPPYELWGVECTDCGASLFAGTLVRLTEKWNRRVGDNHE